MGWTAGVIVDLVAGTATATGGVSGIRNVIGGNGDDILIGDGADNLLSDGNGNDIVIGGGGDDTLQVGSGRDILLGGSGRDTLRAGTGDDILLGGTTAYFDETVRRAERAVVGKSRDGVR
jgi:Ca2+-binding RTX toxin-like protein